MKKLSDLLKEHSPCIITDLSNDEYHGESDHLSSSDLKTMLKDPYEVYLKKIEKISVPNKGSAAMDFGSYIHSLLLEPQKTKDEFIVFDGKKQGKRFQDFKEENPGKIIINELNGLLAEDICRVFDKHPDAPELLKGGQAEISAFTTIDGVKVKARADYLTDKYIIDIKTTAYPLDDFRKVVEDRDYGLSAALYMDIFNADGIDRDFLFIAIFKGEPQVKIFKASKETIEHGRNKYKRALKLYKGCKESGNWKLPIWEEV